MLRLSCFVLLVGIVLGLELAQLHSQWRKFKSTYGKRYSGEEERKREDIFRKHVEAILLHNLEHDMGECDFTQGVNEFSDMSHEEFVKNMCGVKGPRAPLRNNQVFKPSESVPLPDTVDWRDKNVVSPIKNQGTTCGSCWAFSATGAIESAWAIAHGELIVLSDQQLLDCTNTSYNCYGCQGGWPDLAIQYVADNHGQDTQKCYPDLFTQNAKCEYQENCKAVKISKSLQIPPGSEAALQDAVANIGPISVCMDAGQPDFQNYNGGIYNSPNCSQITDHAVLIVGYGTNENGTDYWLLKNSWGASWGEEGYFKLFRDANGTGVCGITTSASYPVV